MLPASLCPCTALFLLVALVGLEPTNLTAARFKRAVYAIPPQSLGTDGEIRTLTGCVLSAVSLPLEYVSVVLPEGIEPSLKA